MVSGVDAIGTSLPVSTSRTHGHVRPPSVERATDKGQRGAVVLLALFVAA
jgi:hypothetical protein